MSSSNEDYLDSLLRAAMEPPKPPSLITESKEETKPEPSPEPVSVSVPETESVFEAEQVMEDQAVAEEIAQDILEVPGSAFDDNQIISQIDMEALPAEMSDMTEIAEPEADFTDKITETTDMATEPEMAEEEAAAADVNQKMSQEDIEAMFAGINDMTEIAESAEELSDAITETTDMETEPEIAEEEAADDNQRMTQEDIEAMISNLSESTESDIFEKEQLKEQEMAVDLESAEDIDALLGIKEMPANYKDEMFRDVEGEAVDAEKASEPDLEDQDLSDILDLLGGDDSELAEINDILKKSDNNEVVDSESIDEIMADSFDDGESADGETDESNSVKKKIKLFGKKKKKKDDESVTEALEGESQPDGEEGEKPKKKKGLFSKLFDTLTEEVEDEAEAEDEERPKKEKKRKKDKKKGKASAETNEEILDEMEQEDKAADKKKKKKEKKPKKQKEPKIKKIEESDLEEPVKKLPKKMIIRIFVLCFSIFGIILILNAFVPQMLSLQRARGQFYKGNYETAYKELISHENLNESDAILLKKAELLMHIKRKKDMYDAYARAGMKEDALNALLEAAAYYADMQEQFAVYGISYEAEQTYILIHSTLTDVYGFTDEEIHDILQLDNITYTYLLKYFASGRSISDFMNKNGDENERMEDKHPQEQTPKEEPAAEIPVPEQELQDPLEAEFD